MNLLSVGSNSELWNLFLLFVIPVGGGIPAGVLFAQSKGFGWLTTGFVYFVSDVLLAVLFEPLMLLFIVAAKHSTFLKQVGDGFKNITHKTIARYGPKPGVFLLVLISFGVDPMTGRAAAKANGHGFVAGWAIAIVGDLIFFAVLMVSTIELNSVLGDGTLTSIIILCAMFFVPVIVRRIRNR